MLLGLVGYAGAGKDTVADTLVERGWTRVAFADPIRELALGILSVTNPADAAYVRKAGWDYAKWNSADLRTLLQHLGVTAREVLGPDVWVDAAMRTAAEDGGDVVLTDVRFPNEVSAIRDRGGILWEVRRPNLKPVNNHVSEELAARAGDVVDDAVDNAGTLAHLAGIVAYKAERLEGLLSSAV